MPVALSSTMLCCAMLRYAVQVLRVLEATDAQGLIEHGQFYRPTQQTKVWGKGRVRRVGNAGQCGWG